MVCQINGFFYWLWRSQSCDHVFIICPLTKCNTPYKSTVYTGQTCFYCSILSRPRREFHSCFRIILCWGFDYVDYLRQMTDSISLKMTDYNICLKIQKTLDLSKEALSLHMEMLKSFRYLENPENIDNKFDTPDWSSDKPLNKIWIRWQFY